MTALKKQANYLIPCLSLLLCFEACKEDQILETDPSSAKPNADVTVSTYAGSTQGYQDGPGAQAKFLIANYLSAGADGNLYIGDYNRIRKINKDGIVSTLAGGREVGAGETPADGTGTDASFGDIAGVAISPSGMIYVSENRGDIYLRRVSSEGVVVTENFSLGSYSGALAIGPDSSLYSIDMDPAFVHYGNWIIKQTPAGIRIWRAEIPGSMYALTVDHKGDVYMVLIGAFPGARNIFRLSETRITKLSTNPPKPSGKLSSIPKISQTSQLPDNYRTSNADIIDVADDGTVFFADPLKITKIAPDGTASILAGGEQGYVDGPASQARFERIFAIELAENDNVLFVSDAYKIRKITLE